MLKPCLIANRFVLGVFAVILLAWWAPGFGSGGGGLSVGHLQSLAVVWIFLMQGLGLEARVLIGGLRKLRLHLAVQVTGYLLIPLMAVLLLQVPGFLPADASLEKGVLFLALLPTTIATAVALTTLAEGDTAGALFNTVLSNLLGVVVIPATCLFLLGEAGGHPGMLLRKIVQWVVLPMAAGQLARIWLSGPADRLQPWMKGSVTACVLFILYAAMCESFSSGVYGDVEGLWLLRVVLFVAVLLVGASLVAWWMGQVFALPRRARVAQFYCGSQKTLAAGLPIASVAFAGLENPEVVFATFVLPLLIYHPLQLMLGSLMVGKLKHWLAH